MHYPKSASRARHRVFDKPRNIDRAANCAITKVMLAVLACGLGGVPRKIEPARRLGAQ
jgi:hypothetical protein